MPSRAQLEWQRDELALFLHFGVNTFADREWGDGTEDPAIFAPARLDTRQWARVAKAAGAKALILTAKHHDGFCLWPTKTTGHCVANSPFRGGRGDVVREFVDACGEHNLKAGLYLSPWDRNAKVYGDSPRYNEFYWAQLTELLTQYGRIDEVWFDGANGEGPNGKKQIHDWPATWALMLRLQPEAVIFSDAGPGVRWIGNENGVAGETNWSTVVRATLDQLFANDLTRGRALKWRRTGDRSATAEVDLGRATAIALADMREPIEQGQSVARYTLEHSPDGANWQPLSHGTTIGYRKLDRFAPTLVRRVRLTINDAIAMPRPVSLGLYG